MAKEDKSKALRNGNKKDNWLIDDIGQTVAEGSTVVLDAHDFIKDMDIDTIKSYSWKQKNGNSITVANLANENTQNLSFTAPYVVGDEVNTVLNFELTTTDNNGKTTTHNASVIVKRVHRAIIFQGGVSLGAYEAGVFQALVKKLSKEDESKRGLKNGRPLFDIVAGTSIGAMNAAIVISNVTKEGKSWDDDESWRDSSKEVIEFWRAQQQHWPTVADALDMNPVYHFWWDIVHNTSKVFKHSITESIELYLNMNPSFKKWYDYIIENWFFIDPNFWKDYLLDGWYIPATAEARRRYYSAKQFNRFGALNVASGIIPWSIFGKFFDFSDQLNYMPRADNKHFVYCSLKKTLERFAHFPIRTKEPQPRFLLVTIDVKTGDAVTFDSYSVQTIYHDDRKIIHNQNGIEIEHALATGTFPDFFDYPTFKVNTPELGIKNEEHIFWDGGFTSNTPLREVIQAHRDYWHKTRKHKEGDGYYENDVPDLEVYIADLWPSELKEEPISFDRDFVENRKWGILFSDKTDYDEQVANVITDYVDLAKQLKHLAERRGASADEIKYILNKYASSKNTKGQTRIYEELLGGRFRLTKVVRIDHKDDGNDVANKVFDYSYKTIEKLMECGYRDALVQMSIQSMKDRLMELAKISGSRHRIEKEKEDNHIQKLEESLHDIQESIKIENGYDTTLNEEVDKFITQVESIEEQNENRLLLKEEKTLLIAAAKQFQEIIKKTKNQQNLLPQIL